MSVSEVWVRIFANLVRMGRRSVEQLPEAYQEPVREYLKRFPDRYC